MAPAHSANGTSPFMSAEDLLFSELTTTQYRDTFFTPEAKAFIGWLWTHAPEQYVEVKANAGACGIFGKDFDRMAEALAHQEPPLDDAPPGRAAGQAAAGTAPGPEPDQAWQCPELPATAQCDATLATEAAPWLDTYCDFSSQWAPRAYSGFHAACGLAILSAVAARRVRLEFGPQGVYTSLYLALAAQTSLYTKTTVVDIALTCLRKAGFEALLADDDATPQAFLRSLSRRVPENYADLPPDEQEAVQQQLAFAGQKVWVYDEFGQHLQAMMQRDGMMAAFRSILRRLDDHQERYVYSTIARGRETLYKPYLTVLANVTPADLKPFVHANGPLWRDGYIARLAFIAPGDRPPGAGQFPEGAPSYPVALLRPLQHWHQRLGVPQIVLTPAVPESGTRREAGRYTVTVRQALPERTYRLSPEVRRAVYAYDAALQTLMREQGNEDLYGSYARFPNRALRIAGLLASLQDTQETGRIEAPAWHRGQQLVEGWRQDLHALMQHIQDAPAPSEAAEKEERLVRLLRAKGAQSIVGLHKLTKWGYGELGQLCTRLAEARVLHRTVTSRTVKYSLNGKEES